MVLSNASIINVVLAQHSGDIDKLMIDKSLVGKLSGETVSDGMCLDKNLPRHTKYEFLARLF